MSKINLLITDANGNLREQEEVFGRVVRRVEAEIMPRLRVDWDINVLMTNRMRDIVIPEDGVGGRTYTGDFIALGIDEGKATEPIIFEMLGHELCHAARWGKNDEWANTLLDMILNEGISTYFEAEITKDDPEERQYFLRTVLRRTDRENLAILDTLRGNLDDEFYDREVMFFGGNDVLPRWSGYSLGYYLVREYLAASEKKIEEAFADKYAEFKEVLRGVITPPKL